MESSLFASKDAIETPAVTPDCFARVAVERSLGHGSEAALTYACTQDTAVGDRVRVPLGRGNTPAEGIVVTRGGPELLNGFDAARVKPVLNRSPSGLPAALVQLAAWISDYYCCPLGMTLATMTPASVKRRTGARTITLLDRPEQASSDEPKLAPTAKAAWRSIAELYADTFPIEPRALADTIGSATLAPINRLVRAGLLTQVEAETVRTRERQQRLPTPASADTPPDPTHQQAAAIDGIGRRLDAFGVHLLHGITGSGKTEVYLRLIQQVLEAGKSAIVLVPEIALTPQTSARFLRRFGAGSVVVMHSGLTGSQRNAAWEAARLGKARVVVGARSAVFAPLDKLGLIIVDEEHDPSFKQDQLPRYHGRDVAIKRAHLQGIPVVLGSATPALESWANARAGRYRLWSLTERVGSAKLPAVQLVDVLNERRIAAERKLPMGNVIGPTLADAIRSTLDNSRQVMLLMNRRGFSNAVVCASRTCGWKLDCDHCNAAMVLHKSRDLPKRGVLKCHHCLAEQTVPTQCPACSGKLVPFGIGTQQIEAELEEHFDLEFGRDAIRLDADTMQRAGHYFEALSKFERGEARVLLGTQMIAKGLDFPGVGLVGVVSADTSLNLPDFRAYERTFQLVSQVAGRAGRADAEGLVIVQTLEPNADPIRLAAAHDYKSFAESELAAREAAGYPPSARMARVVVRDKSLDKAQSRADAVAKLLRQSIAPGVRLDGPMPAPIARVADHHRIAIEIIGPTPGAIRATLAAARDSGQFKSDAHTAVDVDPVALM
ncbi:MAG: primosomal protein N' [Planctomycetota bacterium]